MADYYQLKNQNIFNPPANTSLGNTSNQFGNAFVQNNFVLGNVTVTGSTINTPKVSTIGYPGDDTAADPAGGQTITLTGSGFLAGASVLINGSAVSVVTVVSTTSITFTSPANSTGSYVLYVINTDGGTAIAIPGIQYSGVPTWTTAAGTLGSVYETASFNQTVTATGDAPITYSLYSGSIPPGATFNSNGTITGTSQVLSSPTTYTFIVRATDAELQDTNRSFSLTITPDVVTWVSPANGTTYTTAINSAISNVVLSATSAVGSGITYTANALPTGISLAGANISGTPTVEANSSSLLTATANTTSELSSITINWVISVANDVYFEYNTLLIPGASTTFVDDASTNNFAVTINGDTKPNNFNPYTPGYYSNYFDGTGDYISVPDNVVFTMGAGDFTLEAWVYLTTSGVSRVIIGTCDAAGTQGSMSYTLSVNASNNAYFAVGYGGAMYGSTNTTTILTNQWVHIAGVRSGANIYVYLNGVQSTSNTNMGALAITDSSQVIGIGRNGAYNGEYVTGYISNTRIVKGLAVYTGAFTVPTSPLQATQSSGTNIAAITGTSTSLLTCQSNRFIDNSTTPFTVTVAGNTTINSFIPFTPNSSYSTYGSGYFDGSGDYLTLASSTAFGFGTGDFTIEYWIYPSLTGDANQVVADFRPSDSGTPLLIGLTTGGAIRYYDGTTVRTGGTMSPNTWNHVAWSRASGVNNIYLNGVQVSTYTATQDFQASRQLTIGSNVILSAERYIGYLSNLRIVKGTAVYTSAFTPPTTPLTAIANTSLLTLQNNQSVNNNVFLDNSTNNFLVTRNGNTTQGTFSPYGGNWSNYFDGTGDYLTVPSSSALGLSTGNFTIEAWVYTPSFSAIQAIIDLRSGAVAEPLALSISSTGLARSYDLTVRTGGQLNASQWNHIAWVRASGTNTVYVNGVVGHTWSNSGDYGSSRQGWIGISAGAASEPFTGYISNMRIVKGTALYTTTFTPSTTPLTAIANTSLLTCQSNRFIDNSVNNLAITRNGDTVVRSVNPFKRNTQTSMYFDGTGDYIYTPTNASYGIGSAKDFTIETWAYPITAGTGKGIFQISATAGGLQASVSTTLAIAITGTNAVEMYTNGTYYTTAAARVPLGVWTHLAIVRLSGVTKLYINGVLETSIGTAGSIADTTAYPNTSLVVGGYYSTGYLWNGYIEDFRITKDAARYTGTFTPPAFKLANR